MGPALNMFGPTFGSSSQNLQYKHCLRVNFITSSGKPYSLRLGPSSLRCNLATIYLLSCLCVKFLLVECTHSVLSRCWPISTCLLHPKTFLGVLSQQVSAEKGQTPEGVEIWGFWGSDLKLIPWSWHRFQQQRTRLVNPHQTASDANVILL